MEKSYMAQVYCSDLDMEGVAIGDNNPSRGWSYFSMKKGARLVAASVSVEEEVSIVMIGQEESEDVDVPVYQTLSRSPLPPQVAKHGICLGSAMTEEAFQYCIFHKIPGASIVVFLLPEGFTDHPPYPEEDME